MYIKHIQHIKKSVFKLLRLTEDILEMLVQEEGEAFGSSVGRIYLRRVSSYFINLFRQVLCIVKG